MMQPGTRVRVTNHNDFTISDRYDGVPEVFEPGKPKELDPEAAAHIFGFPIDEQGVVLGYEASQAYVCRRWGWNTPNFGIPKSPEGKQVLNAELAMENAAAAFKNIEIEVVHYNLVEVGKNRDTLPAARKSASRGPIKVEDKPKRGMSDEARAAARQRMLAMHERKRAEKSGETPPASDQGAGGAAA